METLVRGNPPRADLHLDDHQRHSRHSAGALRRGGPQSRERTSRRLSGTVQNDILKEYIARGTYIYPPPPGSAHRHRPVFAWCRERIPEWNTISISGYHIREAGSTAVQEVAFTLADAIAYVEAALGPGPGRGRLRTAPVVLLQRPQQSASRKWPSSAPRDGFGRASCGKASRPKTRARGCSASTPKPPVPRSPRSSRM